MRTVEDRITRLELLTGIADVAIPRCWGITGERIKHLHEHKGYSLQGARNALIKSMGEKLPQEMADG